MIEIISENWWMFWNPCESGLIGGGISAVFVGAAMAYLKYAIYTMRPDRREINMGNRVTIE